MGLSENYNLEKKENEKVILAFKESVIKNILKIYKDMKNLNSKEKNFEDNFKNNQTLQILEKMLEHFVKKDFVFVETKKRFLFFKKTKILLPIEEMKKSKIVSVQMLKELYETMKEKQEQKINKEVQQLLKNLETTTKIPKMFLLKKYPEINDILINFYKTEHKLKDRTNINSYGTKAKLYLQKIESSNDLNIIKKTIDEFRELLFDIEKEIENEINLIELLKNHILKIQYLHSVGAEDNQNPKRIKKMEEDTTITPNL